MTTIPAEPATLADLGTWLASHVEWLRHHRDGHEAVDEITAAVAEVRRIIDRPADRWYAGPCPCGTDLYARPNSPTVDCPGCRHRYDLATHRRWLLTAVEDVLATTTEISRAVTTLGHPVTPDSIRGYVRRGRLIAHSRNASGKRLYRIGDVLDLVATDTTTTPTSTRG